MTINEEILEARQAFEFDTRDLSTLQAGEIYAKNPTKLRWNTENKSKLIELLFIGVPMPTLHFSVLDGYDNIVALNDYVTQNITGVIHEFLSGKLVLKGLKFIPSLNGVRFDDLSTLYKRKFGNINLRAIYVQLDQDFSEFSMIHELEELNTHLYVAAR